MKTLARPTTIAVLFLTVAVLTVAQSAPAHAQSCSGKCVYTQDCVDCAASARCAAESEAAPFASRIQVKAVKLKARS
jgi:hypothetical protein